MAELKENQYYIGIKIKIYPTDEQKDFLENCFNINRYVYNWALSLQNEQYEKFKAGETDKKRYSRFELYKLLAKHRNETEWLSKVPFTSCRSGITRLDSAFNKFFKGQCKYPKFKSKKKSKQSFTTRAGRMYFENNLLRIEGLPKGEKIYTKYFTNLSKKENPDYFNAIISKDNLGNYYISYKTIVDKPVEYFEKKEIPSLNRAIGIDLNVKKRFVLSTGDVFYAPDTRKLYNKIKNLHRICNKDFERYNKLKRTNSGKDISQSKRSLKRLDRLKKAYKKIYHIEENFIHTTTKKIVDMNPTMIVMENLSVKNMEMGRHRIAKLTHFSNFYWCRSIMQEKANVYNIPFMLAPKYFKSSQICSKCGNEYKIGTSKVYRCKYCGNVIDRDLNAAINLENLAYE